MVAATKIECPIAQDVLEYVESHQRKFGLWGPSVDRIMGDLELLQEEVEQAAEDLKQVGRATLVWLSLRDTKEPFQIVTTDPHAINVSITTPC